MRIGVLLLILFTTTILGFSQESKPTKAEVDRMEMTIAYYLIQINAIEAIAAKFPKLAVAAQDALREWNKEFYPSIQELDKLLLLNDSSNWEPKKELMANKYSRADYSRIKGAEAKDYIFEVNNRAVGKIESPVLETLLEFNPQYRKQPDQEFTERYVKEILTKKQANAQGLDMKFFVPQSWKQISENINNGPVVTYANRFGEGHLFLTVYVEKAKTSGESKKTIPQATLIRNYCSDSDVIEYKTKLSIDNCPAARVTFYKSDGNVEKTGEIYGFAYKDTFIKMIFELKYPITDKDLLVKEYEKNKVLIQKIKDSVVILSQWYQKSK
jgi:hypothetical protein